VKWLGLFHWAAIAFQPQPAAWRSFTRLSQFLLSLFRFPTHTRRMAKRKKNAARISFENGGELLISPVAHEEDMRKVGIITDRVVNVGTFAEPQREFLEFHRDNLFLKSSL